MSRPYPVPVAQALLEALPALIEQAAATGGPLALAVYAMRTALAEAQRVVDAADQPGQVPSGGESLRRRGG